MGWLLLCLHLLLFHFLSFSSSSSSHSLCHPDQSSALLQFKTSFIIDTAEDDYYGMPNLKTKTWINGTDCCSWLGITCHPISGHVIGLDLNTEGFQGIIHHNSTLFRLSHLKTLNLAFNNFSNHHLSSQFGGFASLTHLNLSGSNFEGEVPSQISHLSKLVSLDFSWNDELKWKETTWKRLVQNATALRELVLDDTDLSSIRPSLMSSLLNLSSSLVTLSLVETGLKGHWTNDIICLPNLQQLRMSSNLDLQGQLPKLSCSTSLRILDLAGCQYQGSIPSSFSNLTHLIDLSLSDNNLNGSIPSSFSNLTHLIYLILSNNFLNGSIPSSLLTLPRLTFLYLSSNQLSGQIPDVFSQPNKFQEIDFGNNNIEGELPSSLSNLQHLIQLDLSSNKLSNPIPNVFGGLTQLKTLELKDNNLGGQIPSSLFDLTQLSELDLSYNKLEGPLPYKITGFSNLTGLWLYNNLLNGTIPSWCLSLPSLVHLDLSNNLFTGHVSAISSYSLTGLDLSNNKLQGNIPVSVFDLVNLTELYLSSNKLNGSVNFQLFSKLQNLKILSLSQNSQLSLNFKSKVNYHCSHLLLLDLSSINLTKFPRLSRKLPSLNFLDLSNNKLDGRVPNWLHEMDSLQFLNLSQNLLTSSLEQVSRNYGLSYLDLSFNLLADEISSLICNASSLQILNLSHNKLTGIIPQCLANLSSLEVLDIQMNKFYGTFPSTFSKNKGIQVLNLNDNQFEGLLPESLSNCTALEILNLGNNQIKDTFPHWLQTLPSLKVLILRANKLYGPIGDLKAKHSFHSLIVLDISCNNFSGPIPKAYIKKFKAMKNFVQDESDSSQQYLETGYIDLFFERTIFESVTVTTKKITTTFVKIPRTFVSIDISNNKFEGEIPNVIGELHGLKGLNLSHNRLVGPIPKSMRNLANMESLDLSSNMLSGEIPTELIELNYLEVLNLSHNHLVGKIPQGKQFDTFSNDSYDGNLGLCGLPLSIKCRKDDLEQRPPPLPRSEDKFEFGWKPVAIGYGCGMVFGIGLGCCVLLIGKPQWLVRMVGGQSNKKVKIRTRMRRTRGTMSRLLNMS